MFIDIISITLCGMLLSGIWFGLNVLCNILSKRIRIELLSRYSIVISAALPTILILHNNYWIFNIKSLFDWKSWGLLLITVAITSLAVLNDKSIPISKRKELFEYAIDGLLMEIPQRMMMQSFVCLLLEQKNRNLYISAPITAVIWCISIGVQYIIIHKKLDKAVFSEIIPSFIFSLGVGIVLIRTRFILFTMVAHFLERIFSSLLKTNQKNI